MTVKRIAVMSALMLSAVAQAGQARYLTLLNRAHDSVVAVEVAVQGSEAYQPRAIDPLSGGGGSTTVRLGEADCRFDVRLQFRNGRQAVYRDVDACKGDALVIVPLPVGSHDSRPPIAMQRSGRHERWSERFSGRVHAPKRRWTLSAVDCRATLPVIQPHHAARGGGARCTGRSPSARRVR